MSKPLVNVDTKKHSPSSISFIEILMDESTAMLMRHGEPTSDAGKISCRFIEKVCQRLHGSIIYFGKNSALEIQVRNKSIKKDYSDGATIDQLSTKHSLSTRQIHTIVHRKKNIAPAKAATSEAYVLAILATRMMMEIGIEKDDAKNAARGLLAVVAVRLGGKAPYIANHRYVKGIIKQITIVRDYKAGKSIEFLAAKFNLTIGEIRNVLKNHPVTELPDTTELPKIKTSLFKIATSFSGYAEINTLLKLATEQISSAESIIVAFNQQKGELKNAE